MRYLLLFQNLAPGIKICDRGSLSLLGSPIFNISIFGQGFENTVEKTITTVENLLNKAELLSRHVAYTLIKNCVFIPKFNFLLRTTPFWKFSNYINSIDSSSRGGRRLWRPRRSSGTYSGPRWTTKSRRGI
jgi:hypothetical protein